MVRLLPNGGKASDFEHFITANFKFLSSDDEGYKRVIKAKVKIQKREHPKEKNPFDF